MKPEPLKDKVKGFWDSKGTFDQRTFKYKDVKSVERWIREEVNKQWEHGGVLLNCPCSHCLINKILDQAFEDVIKKDT